MRSIYSALIWAFALLTMVVGSFTFSSTDAFAANAEVELLELRVDGLQKQVKQQSIAIGQLQEAAKGSEAAKVAELAKANEALAGRVETLEGLVNAEIGGIVWLNGELVAINADFVSLQSELEYLTERVERLEAAEAKDHASYFSLAAGVSFTGSVRRDFDTVGVRELPTRSSGVGPNLNLCYESLDSSGTGWGTCLGGNLSAYGYKGVLAMGNVSVLRVFGPRFAVGAQAGVLNETHGVYDSMPYLFGSSTGLTGSSIIRITPVILDDSDVVWDSVLAVGFGRQRDLTQGHIEIAGVTPFWISLTIQRRKVVEGGFPAHIE